MVRVRLFAGLRERAGWSERELDGVERVADVWTALGLGEEPPGLLYAVNFEYADKDTALTDGDEVYIVAEGDTFLSRYRILKIGNATIEFEEVSSGRQGKANLEDAGPNT